MNGPEHIWSQFPFVFGQNGRNWGCSVPCKLISMTHVSYPSAFTCVWQHTKYNNVAVSTFPPYYGLTSGSAEKQILSCIWHLVTLTDCAHRTGFSFEALELNPNIQNSVLKSTGHYDNKYYWAKKSCCTLQLSSQIWIFEKQANIYFFHM